MGGGKKSGAKARTVEPKDTRAEYTMEAFDAFIAKNEPMDAIMPAREKRKVTYGYQGGAVDAIDANVHPWRYRSETKVLPAEPEHPVQITFGKPWDNKYEKGEKNVYAYIKKPGEKFGEKVKIEYNQSFWNVQDQSARGIIVETKLVRDTLEKKFFKESAEVRKRWEAVRRKLDTGH